MIISRIGRLLRGFRAGEARMAWNHPSLNQVPETLRLVSPGFAAGGWMPPAHAGHGVGDNRSPALAWSGLPAGTVSLVLVMEDPDVPLPRPFVHLIAYGIDPRSGSFAEGALAQGSDGFQAGRNTYGPAGYQGPRALPGHGPHRYVFQLFALDRALSFTTAPTLKELLAGMDGAVLARGRLDGLFEQA